MKKNLLSEIMKLKDISNVIILTHNIDFVFVQSLLLRALKNSRAPSLTIFADRVCASDVFTHQAKYLETLGRRYRVVPVPSKYPYRFHPKACFLSGKKSAHLYIGSGNLSFGGWKENAEVWTHFDSDEGVAAFLSFRKYLEDLLEKLELNKLVAREVDAAFDFRKHEWIPENTAEIVPSNEIIGRLGSGPSLLDRMSELLGDEVYDSLTVCSPYYDPKASAFRELTKKINANKIQVLVSAKGNNLTPVAYNNLLSDADVKPVSGKTADGANPKANLVHAKFYAVQRDSTVKLLLGSANCSYAAITSADDDGNSELMAYRELGVEDFENDFLGEIHTDTHAIEIKVTPNEDRSELSGNHPAILAARKDLSRLAIAFSPPDCQVVGVQCDYGFKRVKLEGPGVCSVELPASVSSIQLKVHFKGQEILTALHWIDHEQELSTTSFRRVLEESLISKVSSSGWSTRVLADVVKLFVDDLQDTPIQSNEEERSRASGLCDDSSYHRSELYSSQISSAFARHAEHHSHLRRLSLPELILHYLGYYNIDANGESDAQRDRQAATGIHPEGNTDEDVDQPEEVTTAKSQSRIVVDSEADKERARKQFSRLVKRIAVTFESEEYRRHRHSIDLARDIKLVALVLRDLVTDDDHWITRVEFYEVTQRILSALFLGLADQLPVAVRTSKSPEVDSALIDPEVAGALFAWTLLVHEHPESRPEAHCLLSLSIAVSRFPEIWKCEDAEAMVNAVDAVLKATNSHVDYNQIQARWGALAQLSATLQHWELILGSQDAGSLKRMNRAERIDKGELLFQPPWGLAICDSADQILRNSSRSEKILLIAPDGNKTRKIQRSSLNPVRGLMENETIRNTLIQKGGDPEALLSLCRIIEKASSTKKSDILERSGLMPHDDKGDGV